MKHFMASVLLPTNNQVIVLYGNLAVLGLLILQKHSRRPKSTDYSIFRYIQVRCPSAYAGIP